MDINIFIKLNELIHLNKELIKSTNLTLYGAYSPEARYQPLSMDNDNSWIAASKLDLLLGHKSNDSKIRELQQSEVLREQRINFVTIQFGGEDEFALGASRYSADPSPTSRIVNKELRKLLNKLAHTGVKTCHGDIIENHFWTDGALACGKQWHRFLRTGIYQKKNSEDGYRPAL
ncbi:hypothetical protein [Pseudomonas sp. B21-031]|jgi:hypothetical protein|uniref:hypothetical protein n=1 Tax=Pseudomonas sp. B21-031 TaxID=2895482 RepID=UPI00215FB6DE|nr:hypothetical protein [Pseudomonas sp. B21-031]UVL64790.1 hypothetical protein LOY53_15250 [Pseudomonas sp. B21-031]